MVDTTFSAQMLPTPALLADWLLSEGWRVIGPKAQNGAILQDVLSRGADLPRGLTDAQSPGRYRVEAGEEDRWFDYVVGPQNWKTWLFPARQKLWDADRRDDGFEITPQETAWPGTVFFGVRPCDLAALGILDGVFRDGPYADPGYTARRADTLIVAVNCARAAETCFCASMDTGPRADAGYDIALTELDGPKAGLLAEAGSATGQRILDGLGLEPATAAQRAAAARASEATAQGQSRKIPPDIRGALAAASDSPRWDEIAERCLSCANCTMACPTCFCSDVEDVTDLSGDHAERWRSWDSCFTGAFSYIHGGSVRRSTSARYRQWMTHKLSAWHDQFGQSGCVGCGRCIAWCPVGIDITAEAAVFHGDSEAERSAG